MCNSVRCSCWFITLYLLVTPVYAQYYPENYHYNQYYDGAGQPGPSRQANYHGNQLGPQNYAERSPTANLQYDERDAEMILRDQLSRAGENMRSGQTGAESREQMYDNFYGHRIHDEGQVSQVMTDARNISSIIKNRNGKPFVVIDKRNFQFYLYDSDGRLLRIGPVAIGKGRTDVGAFETPVGIFPIKTKIPVDDWIRPDWYFIEEGEPVPKRWEDRRVQGFFRYKLVFDGTRYIHYAEATGGRLTHGCLGLDWHDAEAVFHTLQVGSHCIIVDQGFLARLARGEFPVQKPVAKPSKPDENISTASAGTEAVRTRTNVAGSVGGSEEKVLRNLW